MNTTQSKGNSLELICIAKLIEMGYECSIPYGNSALYDFIADIKGNLIKIQCKNCVLPYQSSTHTRDIGAFQIPTTRQTTNTRKTTKHTYNKSEIDYFMTMYSNKFYLIPVEECNTVKILRVLPPKNNIKAYNKAEDYELEQVILKL